MWQVSDVAGVLHVVGGNNTVIHGVISGDCLACCIADLQNPDSNQTAWWGICNIVLTLVLAVRVVRAYTVLLTVLTDY